MCCGFWPMEVTLNCVVARRFCSDIILCFLNPEESSFSRFFLRISVVVLHAIRCESVKSFEKTVSCSSTIKMCSSQSLDAHNRVAGISFWSIDIEPSITESHWTITGHRFLSDRQWRCLSEQITSTAEYLLCNTESSRYVRCHAAHSSTELFGNESAGEGFERVIRSRRMTTKRRSFRSMI